MRRRIAEEAEVIDGGDEAAAEEVLPDVVDCDAGRERVGGIYKPAREIEPVGSGAARAQRRQDGRCARLHFVARLLIFAAEVDARLALMRDQNGRSGLGVFGLLGVMCGEWREEFLARRVGEIRDVTGDDEGLFRRAARGGLIEDRDEFVGQRIGGEWQRTGGGREAEARHDAGDTVLEFDVELRAGGKIVG